MTGNRRSAVGILVDENVGLIEQAVELITSIDPALYANNDHELFESGVGRHLRHILDFYERFLDGRRSFVDYNARRRDERVESDPTYASECARAIIERLREIEADATAPARGGAAPLVVSCEVFDDDGGGLRAASSVERELSALASHSVHHYAIIALLLRAQGQSVPSEFGVAPSTLRHRASQGS